MSSWCPLCAPRISACVSSCVWYSSHYFGPVNCSPGPKGLGSLLGTRPAQALCSLSAHSLSAVQLVHFPCFVFQVAVPPSAASLCSAARPLGLLFQSQCFPALRFRLVLHVGPVSLQGLPVPSLVDCGSNGSLRDLRLENFDMVVGHQHLLNMVVPCVGCPHSV